MAKKESMVSLAVALLVFSLGMGIASAQAAGLKKGFYKKSCPQAEAIAQEVVWGRVAANPELAAKFLHMFFHDCFVRGCDASVLLDSASNTAEKNAAPNLSLAGFEVIDEVKAALERACPGVVSCADIVALAARDSVSFQYKKNLWEVETGRRDGTVSSDQEALDNIPAPTSTFDVLLSNFSGKGLGLQDLVVLSEGQCRRNLADLNDNTTVVPMDPGSSLSFDNHYFVNLKARQGMFTSDATLLTDAHAANIVDKLQDPGVFFDHFKNSIKRMGQIGVLTGSNGQIRKKCNVVNS
ncbi:hypothetical protein ACP70R_037561 [Stipagrostis hirtigluma subsp. patula]